MIEHPARQGTDEWIHARLGIPTASQFDKILTPAKMELSSQATDYMHKLLAEMATGCPEEETYAQSKFMEHNHSYS